MIDLTTRTSAQTQLLRLSRKDLHWAQKLFNNPRLVNQISYLEMLRIAGHHLELADMMLSDPETIALLDGKDLSLLVQQHPSLAKRVLDDETMRDKLNSLDIKEMAQGNEEITLHVFNTPELFEKLNFRHCAQLAAEFQSTQQWLQSKGEIIDQFDGLALADFTKNNSALAVGLYRVGFLFRQKEIEVDYEVNGEPKTLVIKRPIIDGDELLIIAQHHKEIALDLIQKASMSLKDTPEKFRPRVAQIKEQLKGYNVHLLGRNDEECALELLKSPSLMQTMGPLGWVELAKRHGEFLKQLVTSRECASYRGQLNGDCLVQMAKGKPNFATMLFNAAHVDKLEPFATKLRLKHLCALAENHSSLAKRILDDSSLSSQLNPNQIDQISYRHPEVATRVLSSKKLTKNLRANHLARMAFAGPDVLDIIMKDDDQKTSICTHGGLPMLCRRYLGVLDQASQDETMNQSLKPHYLEHIQRRAHIFHKVQGFVLVLNKSAELQESTLSERMSNLTLMYDTTQTRKETLSKEVESNKRMQLSV